MAEHTLHQFRLFLRDPPTQFDGWKRCGEDIRWDRHYLIGNRMALRIERGVRVELTQRTMVGRFAVETSVLSSAFPLDWIALSSIQRALPSHYRLCEIDGRNAQAFVDSLALPGLAQASVLKRERIFREGPVIATVSRVDVPDWGRKAHSVNLSCHHPHSLRMALEAIAMDRYQHLAFDDWMERAYGTACAPRFANGGEPSPRRMASAERPVAA